MGRRTNWLLGLITMLVDAGMLLLAFYGAYRLRLLTEYPQAIAPRSFRSYAPMVATHVLTLLVTFFFYRLYHLKPGLSRVDKFYSIAAAVSFGAIASVATTAFAFKNELDYPRAMVIYAWALSIVTVMIGRLFTDELHTAVRKRNPTRLVIVGAGDTGRMIRQKISQSPHLGYEPIGFLDDTPGRTEAAGLPVLGPTSQMTTLIRDHRVQEVIIALPEADRDEVLELITLAEQEKTTVRVFPDVFQIIASQLSIDDLNGLPLLTVRDVALRGWRLTVKRALDVVFSGLFMVFVSPLMVMIALAVKLDSPGPVFYAQTRMGLDAKPFPMIKFRSMRVDAEADTGPVWARKDDPRLGAFIRRHSLDELPQFINVLVGDMSLVGPRPERPIFVEQFRQTVPRYMERHREKAGVTGWAQVNGLRGDTSVLERTKYDLWYIENWSLSLDLKIIIKTAFSLFRDENAY
jgi:exopolysaccharide biosynthesis polyprenyl glycosylphosphotransferase